MKNSLFLYLIYLWIGLAMLFVGYNSIKFVSEIKIWSQLSDFEKREKIFGEKYNLIIFVKSNSDEKVPVYFLTKDPMTFYLSRYYLYPQIVYWINDKEDIKKYTNIKNPVYVVSENKLTEFGRLGIVASNPARNEFLYITK